MADRTIVKRIFVNALARALTRAVRRRRVGLGVISCRSGLQPFPFALLHERVVFRGAGPGRDIGGQATGPLRDGIAHSGRESFVDGSASAQAAGRNRYRRTTARWRGLMDICSRSQPCLVGSRRRLDRSPDGSGASTTSGPGVRQPSASIKMLKSTPCNACCRYFYTRLPGRRPAETAGHCAPTGREQSHPSPHWAGRAAGAPCRDDIRRHAARVRG